MKRFSKKLAYWVFTFLLTTVMVVYMLPTSGVKAAEYTLSEVYGGVILNNGDTIVRGDGASPASTINGESIGEGSGYTVIRGPFKSGSASKRVTDESGDVTYTIVLVSVYTVTWQDYNGTVLGTDSVGAGDTPWHADSTRDGDAQYGYTFSGWPNGSLNGPTLTGDLPPVFGDVTYTATYTEFTNQYPVDFYNEDGQEWLDGLKAVKYGDTPVYGGTTPVKAEDDDYTYTFAGWTTTPGSGTVITGALPAVTGITVYYAHFTATPKAPKTYTVSFSPNGGSGTMSPQIIPCGVSTALDRNTFTYADHTFVGWEYRDADDSLKTVADGASVKDLTTAGGRITLTARWEDASTGSSMEPVISPSPESLYVGDVDRDGIVTPKDVTVLRRYLVGGWDIQVKAEDGDIDGDNQITPKDVTMLRRFLAGGWGVTLPEKIAPIPIEEQVIEKNTVTYIPYTIDYLDIGLVKITNGENIYYFDADGQNVFYSLMDTATFNIVFDDTGRIYINEHNGSFVVASVTCELSEKEYYFRFFDRFGNKIQEEHSHGCGGTTPYGCKLYNLSEDRLIASCFRGIPEFEARLSSEKVESTIVTPVHYSVTQITNDIVQLSNGENRYYFAADKSRVFYSLMDISTFNLVFDDTGKIYINEHNGSFVVDRVTCEVTEDDYYFRFYDRNGNWIQEEHSHGCGGTTPYGCKLYNLSTGKLMASCYRGGLEEDVLIYTDDAIINEENVSHSRYYLTYNTSNTVKLSNGATTYCFSTDGERKFYSLTDTESFNLVFDDTGKIFINEHNGNFVVGNVTCDISDDGYFFKFYDGLGNWIQEEHSRGCGGTTPYGCILYNLSEGKLMASCFRGIPHIEDDYGIEKTEICEDGTVIEHRYYSELSAKREKMLKSEKRICPDGSEYYCDYYRNGNRMKETLIDSDGKKEEKYYRENGVLESSLITFSFGSTQYWTYNEDGQSVKAVGKDSNGNEEYTYNYTYYPKAEGQLLAQIASDIHIHSDGGEWGVIYYRNGCWEREWWKNSKEEGEKIHWENGALKSEYHKYADGSTEETTFDENENELTWIHRDSEGNVIESRGLL